MSFEQWRRSLRERIEPVGECMEWCGAYMGVTPLVYVPRGYLYPGSLQSRHTVRTALWSILNGCRPPTKQVIRARCGNDRCVHQDHWLILDRSSQAREQAKRNELQTVKALTSKMRSARRRAKLTPEDVAAIKTSGVPSRVECLRYGVSSATVVAVRSGRIWSAAAPGASVFSPRSGSLQGGGQ